MLCLASRCLLQQFHPERASTLAFQLLKIGNATKNVKWGNKICESYSLRTNDWRLRNSFVMAQIPWNPAE